MHLCCANRAQASALLVVCLECQEEYHFCCWPGVKVSFLTKGLGALRLGMADAALFGPFGMGAAADMRSGADDGIPLKAEGGSLTWRVLRSSIARESSSTVVSNSWSSFSDPDALLRKDFWIDRPSRRKLPIRELSEEFNDEDERSSTIVSGLRACGPFGNIRDNLGIEFSRWSCSKRFIALSASTRAKWSLWSCCAWSSCSWCSIISLCFLLPGKRDLNFLRGFIVDSNDADGDDRWVVRIFIVNC